MKIRIIGLIITFVMILSVFGIASATASESSLSSSIENSIDKVSFDNAKEKVNVQKVIDKGDAKELLIKLNRKGLENIRSEQELVNGKAYKVTIADVEFIKALLGGGNLPRVLNSAPYEWQVPVFEKNMTTNCLSERPVESFTISLSNDGIWNLSKIGTSLNLEQMDICSNNLTKFLAKNSISNVDEFVHLIIPSLHSDFIYISDNDQEYFIPFIHSREEAFGLKNMKVYSRDQFVSIVGEYLKELLDTIMK